MKKKYKEDRIFKILMLVSLLCIIVIVTFLLIYFFGGTSGSKYGNRLDGLSSYIIEDSKIKDITSSISAEKNIKKTTIKLEGKLFYIAIYLEDKAKSIDGVNAATKALELFTEDQIKYYDFNFSIVMDQASSSEDNIYIMGYKNNTSSSITWTNY